MNLTRFLFSRLHHHVIIHDQVCHDHFNLCGGEKAARTRPDTVPEIYVIDSRTTVLELVFVSGLFPKLGEAERIEDLGRRIQSWRHVDRMGPDHNCVTLWDDVAGRSKEAVWVGNYPRYVHYWDGQPLSGGM